MKSKEKTPKQASENGKKERQDKRKLVEFVCSRRAMNTQVQCWPLDEKVVELEALAH